jgi:predicted metal-dependent phosphoesterase TrpH
VHTTCSFDVLPVKELHPESLYKTALDMGMDYITFTDQDTLEAHEILGWNCEKLVSGPEMSVSDLKFAGRTLHINVSELDIEEFIELWEISEIERDLKALSGTSSATDFLIFTIILSGSNSVRNLT